MKITIVMHESKTLYLPLTTPEQLTLLRKVMADGHGVFEFTQDERTYIVNASNILYIEIAD